MKKCLYLIALLCFISSCIWAQTTKTISGKVVDSSGRVLPDASVLITGTKIGTRTDANGKFTIKYSNDGKTRSLTVSYVGYATTTVAIKSDDITIKLGKANDVAADEVVVIGYQTVRRKDVLASVSSVGAKDLKDVPINSAAEALNGRLAGVTATTAEGSPDADVRIRVRGGISISQDNSPLYIIDGIQVENGLSNISPQDIQSIDVLKDAAATAIYGARGGNGVIIITTKSGKPGKLQVAYNGNIGIKNLAKKLDVMSPYDYVIYQSERARGSATDSTNFLTNFGSTWDTLSNYKNVSPVDWQGLAFGLTGSSQTHNVTASGGDKKWIYNFGYTFNDDKAIVLNSTYKRHIVNFKTEYKVTEKLKVGGSFRYTNQNVFGAGVSSDQGTAYNRLRNAIKYRPFLSPSQDVTQADPLADPNAGNGLLLINPLQLSNSEFRQKTTDALNFTANVSYIINKHITFRSTFGYDSKSLVDRQYSDSLTPYSVIQGGKKPILELDTTKTTTVTNSNVFSYSYKGYKGKHDIDILFGEETYDLKTDLQQSIFRNFPTFTSHNDAINNTTLGSYFTGYPRLTKSHYTNLSFFTRLSYGYKDKYLFSFNLRADGASKFGDGNKWGYFPAASFAWRAKNERFLKNVNFINDLKLRAGYGAVGNNRIQDYLYITTFSNNGGYYYGLNGQAVNAYYSNSLVNGNLKWESTINRNVGLDLAILKNRISLSVDYYQNTSSDLLLNVPIASTYGYALQLQNIGKTSNKGFEVQLSTVILRKKNNLSWTATFNLSNNKNKIEALGVGQKYFYPAASWGVSGQPADYIERIGDAVGSMWGLVTDGFYKVDDFNYANGVYTLKSGVVSDAGIIGVVQPGSIKFKDLNGDGKIDLDNDRKIIGNPTPKFTGGLSQQFTYKQWDMSVFVNFSIGNDIYNANKIELTNAYTVDANMLNIMKDRWKVVTPTGQTAQWLNGTTVMGIAPDQLAALNANAQIWQPLRSAGAFYPHSWAIEDGSFLRLNNVTIGYSLPAKLLAKIKMTKIRLYATGNNLAILTKYTGYDPEVSVRSSGLTPGLDYSAYPKSRSFVFGVNVTF
ncbi:SusC/RagA family TonB-linked outer membrane protein [Parasediminibacterium paludis]|uniref:SusC/RagA family TonB-linked outer membrane protein n=1 Tax=Parasediminibacterium paludis TaxID=908966 RepID=A0ABV8PV70_9BACT